MSHCAGSVGSRRQHAQYTLGDSQSPLGRRALFRSGEDLFSQERGKSMKGVRIPVLAMLAGLLMSMLLFPSAASPPGRALAQVPAGDPDPSLAGPPQTFPQAQSLTATLFISSNILGGSVREFPPGGPLTTFFSLLDRPEGLDIDPTTGDIIVSNDTAGGFLTRIASDGSSAVAITGPIGAVDDIVVDAAGNIVVARPGSSDIVSVSPDGSTIITLVTGVSGVVEELARDPATGDVYWGTIGGQIGVLPGGACPCSTITAPIDVTAMGFDVDDTIPGADLAISQFFGDSVYLVDFGSGTFAPLVANPGTAEDLTIQNGKIIFPDFFTGAILEIDAGTAAVATLIPASSIATPTGVDTAPPPDEQININVVDKLSGGKLEGTCWRISYGPAKVPHDVVGDDVAGVKPDCGEPSNLKLFDKDPSPGNLRITITSAQRVQFGDIWHAQMSFEPKGNLDTFNYECDLSLAKCEIGPVAVGGLAVDLDRDLGDLPLETAQSSGPSAGVLADTIAGMAALAVTLTGAAWYARRRLSSR